MSAKLEATIVLLPAKDPVHFGQEAGCHQSRSGHCIEKEKSLAPTGNQTMFPRSSSP
jgi:hypothetical protein